MNYQVLNMQPEIIITGVRPEDERVKYEFIIRMNSIVATLLYLKYQDWYTQAGTSAVLTHAPDFKPCEHLVLN